jgi:hypothetical protein
MTSEEEIIRQLKGGRGQRGRSSSEDGGGGDAYDESDDEVRFRVECLGFGIEEQAESVCDHSDSRIGNFRQI